MRDYGLIGGLVNKDEKMDALELLVALGLGGVILKLGAKFKYLLRSEFVSMILWVICSLLRRSVILNSSFQVAFPIN